MTLDGPARKLFLLGPTMNASALLFVISLSLSVSARLSARRKLKTCPRRPLDEKLRGPSAESIQNMASSFFYDYVPTILNIYKGRYISDRAVVIVGDGL